jgi:2-haloacid dehalogenase
MSEKRVYVFDAYGTLLDVHSAVTKHAAAIGGDAQRFSETWRAKQLEYTWTYSLMQRYEPFWTLTERALDFAFAKFPSVSRELRSALLGAYRSLDCYAEVPNMLQTLRERGAKTAVLSNGNRDMLDAAFAAAKLDTLVDRLLSVDSVRVFKTDPRVYALVLDAFACSRENVTFVSSNRWDIAGATAFGFSSVWLNRAKQPNEYPSLPQETEIATLHELLTHR